MKVIAVLTSGFLLTTGLASAAPVPGPPAASPRPGDCTLESNIDNDINEGPTDYGLNLRPMGDVDVILLFIDFPDATSNGDTNDIAELLSPIESYYAEVSYDQLNVNIDAIDQWYRMPGNSGSYNYTTHEGQKKVFTDATDAADSDVDFSGYDIILTAEGLGGTHPNSPAWLGAYNAVTTDEGPIRWGSTLGQDIYDPPRGHMTPIHEMGHLFGLPDLYAYEGGSTHRFVGSWDVMGNIDAAPGMSAWHRNKMGWLDEDQVTCVAYSGTTEVTLTRVAEPDGTKLAVVKTSPSRAYAIEYRTSDGLDSNLCDEGILVYRIDANVGSGKGTITLLPAHDPPGGFSCPSDTGGYEPLQTPAFDLGPGEESTFTDVDDDLTIEVLTIDPGQATIRIDYEGGPPQPLDYERNVIITKVNKKKGVIKGHLEAEPGAPAGCAADVPIRLRAASSGKTLARARTSADGNFKIKVKPKGKRTYVYAPLARHGSDYCLTASSTTFKI